MVSLTTVFDRGRIQKKSVVALSGRGRRLCLLKAHRQGGSDGARGMSPEGRGGDEVVARESERSAVSAM